MTGEQHALPCHSILTADTDRVPIVLSRRLVRFQKRPGRAAVSTPSPSELSVVGEDFDLFRSSYAIAEAIYEFDSSAAN